MAFITMLTVHAIYTNLCSKMEKISNDQELVQSEPKWEITKITMS